ncbi:uncharacterized protein F5891DRAFT_985168 [Suillus fuscotomentosus]|uniref:Uncharacterized protein n=1 Tax=Suillus fuscotomentosus TaxID=1912939 RepID=A0AAD4HG57_9AGAM|nr:uncharacterized protein F5891DRAFT_985168 [Suillus fuscotomentosus]KAG1894284.1 hypothetical protein F5891DRAFT_985168 [Suillus fuscotomentosus]
MPAAIADHTGVKYDHSSYSSKVPNHHYKPYPTSAAVDRSRTTRLIDKCERCARNDHVLTQILIIPTPYDAITILHRLFVHRLSDLLAHKMCKPQQDAKDIIFYHDPDDSVPLDTTLSAPQPSSSTNPPQDAFSMLLNTGRKPTPVTAGARQSIQTSKPSAHLRDAENIYSTSTSTSSTNRKRALSSATELQLQPAHKKVFSCLLSDEDSLDDNDTGHDTDPLEDQPEAEAEVEAETKPEDAIQATLPKTERTADICTVFTRHETHWGRW